MGSCFVMLEIVPRAAFDDVDVAVPWRIPSADSLAMYFWVVTWHL